MAKQTRARFTGRARPEYFIREVDGFDDDTAEELADLNRATFGGMAPPVKPEIGQWWVCVHDGAAVGFAGMERSTHYPKCGYFSRVGVLPAHRGRGLQNRFMRTIEAAARRNGWRSIVSDTTENPPSANSFVRRGYRIFSPKFPWSLTGAIYWRKEL